MSHTYAILHNKIGPKYLLETVFKVTLPFPKAELYRLLIEKEGEKFFFRKPPLYGYHSTQNFMRFRLIPHMMGFNQFLS